LSASGLRLKEVHARPAASVRNGSQSFLLARSRSGQLPLPAPIRAAMQNQPPVRQRATCGLRQPAPGSRRNEQRVMTERRMLLKCAGAGITPRLGGSVSGAEKCVGAKSGCTGSATGKPGCKLRKGQGKTVSGG